MDKELFESAVREKGDLAGVFEYDGETGYFYLYDVSNEEGRKVVDSIHVLSGDTDLVENAVAVRWDDEEKRVALFLRGKQCAVFNAITGAKYGGNYRSDAAPLIPMEESFDI